MRRELFQPTGEGTARLLILIDAFTGKNRSLEGRTKLAKLDFFLRYPAFLARVVGDVEAGSAPTLEGGMIRYRYGPWDPAYFALLGSLVGRGLVEVVPLKRGFGYRTSAIGHDLAAELSGSEEWRPIADRAMTLKEHLDFSGDNLRKLVYEHFPEVSLATWGEHL